MKKRRGIVSALLCILLAVFVLSGCEKTSSQIENENQEQIKAENIEDVGVYTQTYFSGTMKEHTYEEFQNVIDSGNVVVSETFDNDWANRWKQFTETHGAVKDAQVDLTQRTEDGGYTSRIILTGEDGELMAFTVTYDRTMIPYATAIAAYSDDSKETLGSKMATAGGNTLTGLIVVFAILVGLSLIIACFKFINKIGGEVGPENKDKKKAAPAPAPDKAAEAAPAKAEEEIDLYKEQELVAVITAAIAAFEDKPVSLYAPGDPNQQSEGYVVRSIRRLHNNKWH